MMNSISRRRQLLLASLGCVFANFNSWAQAPKFPTRPVRMLVPFPVGGGVDAVARLVAQMLSQKLGQQVVVENIPGASGQIGTQAVVRSQADGHTLLFAPPTPITIAEQFEPKPAYDVGRDLVPAALIGRNPAVIVINSAVKANTLQEFFALVKREPSKYFYGSSGMGHAFHLTSEILFTQAGVSMTHVPYQGSGPAVLGVLSGDVQFLVQSVEAVREHVKSGRLRALATLEPNRIDAFPELPTLTESALSNLGIMNWYGVFMPAKTPPELLGFWERELLALAKAPEFEKRMRAMSFDPVAYSSQDFMRMMVIERNQWAAAIKAANVSTKKQWYFAGQIFSSVPNTL